jgi:hypothetical protein
LEKFLQYKKQKKVRISFIQSQWDFLLSLLGVIMMKMKYDEDTDWSDESDEPEEEALFMEMRKVGFLALSMMIVFCKSREYIVIFKYIPSRISRYLLTRSLVSTKTSMLDTSDQWFLAP